MQKNFRELKFIVTKIHNSFKSEDVYNLLQILQPNQISFFRIYRCNLIKVESESAHIQKESINEKG